MTNDSQDVLDLPQSKLHALAANEATRCRYCMAGSAAASREKLA